MELSHQHRAGISEALHDRGIVIRHEVPLDLGADGSALMEARAYSEAADVMERHTQIRPNDHRLWFK